MYDWIGANWIWLVLAIGVVWFLFGRVGMGCGMGRHGGHGEDDGAARAVPWADTRAAADHGDHSAVAPTR